MTRNAIRWLTEEYFAVPSRPNGRDTSHIGRVLLLNQNRNGTFKCCGGYGEHFQSTCPELCCMCGGDFDPFSRWNARRANGPNGFPAHPGCLEDDGWAHMQDRPHDDEAMDVPESILFDQDET